MKRYSDHMNRNNDSFLQASNLYSRIVYLSEKMSAISIHLSESNAAARVSSILKTCIALDKINWEVMNDVVLLMFEVEACNIFPTENEKRIPQHKINEVKELAEDILSDVPLNYVPLNPKPPVSDSPVTENIVLAGTINHLRKVITKNKDIMAIMDCDVVELECEVAVLPRTWETFREKLENHDTDTSLLFICDLHHDSDLPRYILKDIQDIPDPAPLAFEEFAVELFRDENSCPSCEGTGRLQNIHNEGFYKCTACWGTGKKSGEGESND